MIQFETTFELRMQKLKLKRCDSFIMQLLLISIDHCNLSLSTITLILQHTGMEGFHHSGKCRISYTITEIGYLKNT